MLTKLRKDLNKFVKPERVNDYLRFFKTSKGEYGEGDKFLGVTVPNQRKVANKYFDLSLKDLEVLLKSKFHEERFMALIILIHQYKKNPKIVDFYLKHRKGINNWDLVDVSAHKILGQAILDGVKDKKILYNFAKSKNLWEKRISIISTAQFIMNDKFEDTLKISELLLKDDHDLIHKAVGWMLREIGKRNQKVEEIFLKKHYKKMPRTMLRYAIEKFEEKKRQKYLNGLI